MKFQSIVVPEVEIRLGRLFSGLKGSMRTGLSSGIGLPLEFYVGNGTDLEKHGTKFVIPFNAMHFCSPFFCAVEGVYLSIFAHESTS